MEGLHTYTFAVAANFLVAISLVSYVVYFMYWSKPQLCIREKLKKQGVRGPAPSILTGNTRQIKQMIQPHNSHQISNVVDVDYFPSVFPHFNNWTQNYGRMFLFALGRIQLLYVTNPEIVREVRVFRSSDLGKPDYLQKERGALLGKGLITSNGALWSHQRKSIGPLFYMDKIKDSFKIMTGHGNTLIQSWEEIVETEGGIADILVDDHMRNFTNGFISEMMFGDDHHKALQIFPKCRALIKATTTALGLPFLRFVPTRGNIKAWRLEREVRWMILDIVRSRKGSCKGILEAISDAAGNSDSDHQHGSLSQDEFVVDNVKQIYLTAGEVCGIALIWGLMLLASHPDWQARVRSEVVEVSGGQVPNFEMLGQMKLLKMVILEVLRLYPGVALVSRQALKEVKLGNLHVPKDLNIWIMMLALHRDPECWGPDAHMFNPERFANGVSEACKSPNAYMPFGLGVRICPGQNLAMVEIKLLFAMILSKFNLTISPNYRHSPRFGLLLEPEHGVNLLVQKI